MLMPKMTMVALAGVSLFAMGTAHAQSTDQASPTAKDAQGVKSINSQSSIPEIIVTAERRTSDVQDTAAAISVRSGDDLRKEGKTQLRAILENVPGVLGGAAASTGTTAAGGTDTAGAGVVIRGIQSNLGAGGTSVSTPAAVAIYTDDVYEGVGSGYDVDRVEVLRGPQGTLYGRSATGGVVAIHTRDPNLNGVEGLGLLEFGDYALQHVTAALNVPIIDDKLAVRVSGDYYHRDGFDTANGQGALKNKSARIKLLAKPTDNLSILLGAAIQYNEDASGGKSPYYDANHNIYFVDNPVGSGKNHFHQFWANIQWDMGFATLTYIPAYRTWNQDAEIIGAGPGFTVTQALFTPTDHILTNELRLASNGKSRLTWQVGALDYDNKVVNLNAVHLNVPGNPLAFEADTRKKTNAIGVFGEATYRITENWRLTGGLRYDHTSVDVAEDYTSFTGQTLSLPTDQGRLRFNDWTYKIRTEYDLSPRNMIYLSYSTGVSPGDATVTTDPTGQPYVLQLKDETLKALEFGSKNRFLNGKLQVNGAIYYYWYGGYQNAAINIAPPPVPPAMQIIAYSTLVAPVHTFGGELELLYQPTSHDRIGLNLAYTNSRYVNMSDFFKTYIARQDVQQVPPFTANLFYSHRFDLPGGSSLTAAVDGRYLSAHDAGTITALDLSLGGLSMVCNSGVGIANFNATWNSANGEISIGAYVRNITDERYLLNSEITTNGTPPGTTPAGIITGSSLKLYEPRTFGAVATFNF